MSTSTPEILLVEDDAAIRESLVECLEFEGHAVRAAADGPEALAWLRAGNRPRVVVLDLIMPVMTGEELLRRIRAAPDTRDVPVVVMTGTTPSRDLPRVEALIPKPFDLADLLAAVRPFLEGTR